MYNISVINTHTAFFFLVRSRSAKLGADKRISQINSRNMTEQIHRHEIGMNQHHYYEFIASVGYKCYQFPHVFVSMKRDTLTHTQHSTAPIEWQQFNLVLSSSFILASHLCILFVFLFCLLSQPTYTQLLSLQFAIVAVAVIDGRQ